MAIDPYAGCNIDIPSNLCTLETCCLAQSSFNYIPNYGGNIFFAVFFGVFLLPQLGLGIYYKTWGFMAGMLFGLVLEVVGYAARIMLHDNPFDSNGFLIYLICLTIAPVFISAAIYLCLTRTIVLYGQTNSRLAPRTIAIIFMASDFLSLVLQAAGGGIADTANTHQAAQPGINTMIAGLVLQAVSLAAFLIVVADFSLRCRRGVLDQNPAKKHARSRMLFKVFMASLLLATVVVLIRSIFRVAELWGGFNGALWNDETDFLVLDGTMLAIATICLTAFHPGLAFGNQWQAANWTFKSKKADFSEEYKDAQPLASL
ncbi:phospholipid-translocating ATPase rsb1 [Recurvomyces mirabilis]|uniref:Phospholipid-translocating ATPase rsb1 n=1 Tax=Recurvomyces mirabilis TaxID=574656 RepID=A0AAE0WIT7_9PEZI|nr:phospholipid-translocating ATPase rsb1 [Recurvomyces mirabilis]KAK5159740.1 phospholipid-translocating ATPase rsb1 [Recurvomyces mirabilis]